MGGGTENGCTNPAFRWDDRQVVVHASASLTASTNVRWQASHAHCLTTLSGGGGGVQKQKSSAALPELRRASSSGLRPSRRARGRKERCRWAYPQPPYAHICSRDSMHGDRRSRDANPSRHNPTTAAATVSSVGGRSHGLSPGLAPATLQLMPRPVKQHRAPSRSRARSPSGARSRCWLCETRTRFKFTPAALSARSDDSAAVATPSAASALAVPLAGRLHSRGAPERTCAAARVDSKRVSERWPRNTRVPIAPARTRSPHAAGTSTPSDSMANNAATAASESSSEDAGISSDEPHPTAMMTFARVFLDRAASRTASATQSPPTLEETMVPVQPIAST
eukprot:scaffold9330_cov117-Isochrysis_galbana.AAC.2